MTEFGELKYLDPRSVWRNEARDFTPWLANNIRALGDKLGMELELDSQEAPVGDFSLDLLAKDLGSGRPVVIENQLEATNHEHLGKLLTYAGGLAAQTVIWVAKSLRDEHRQALEWLNQITGPDVSFFGVVVEIIQIDNSKPAYNFRVVVSPNEWQKNKSIARPPVSPRSQAYREFFQALIDELREKHRFTNARAGQPQNWYCFGAGVRGFSYCASFSQGAKTLVILNIDLGDKNHNVWFFKALEGERAQIEKELGESLSWDNPEGSRYCSISSYRPGSINAGRDELDSIREWMIEKLLIFKRVFGPRIKRLKTRKEQSPEDAITATT